MRTSFITCFKSSREDCDVGGAGVLAEGKGSPQGSVAAEGAAAGGWSAAGAAACGEVGEPGWRAASSEGMSSNSRFLICSMP